MKKISYGSIFKFGYIYIKILDSEGLKCKLKSVYAADFAKQTASIQEIAEIIQVSKIGATPFPGLLHFTLDPYLILLSVKQGGIKYHF